MRIMQKYLIGLFALFFPLMAANAALCSNQSIAIPASTPTSQFTLASQDAQTVVDNKTGLMWLRCTYGFSWSVSNVRCENTQGVTKNWVEALGLAGINYEGFTGWRVPNVKELASIVERKCQVLAINNEIFPGSPAAGYWTSTHVVGSTTDVKSIDFSTGNIDTAKASSQLYLRLVRDAN
ncbi:MAG: DUF1566 domain-containing protein [Gammaproteobacteria bacterium]|nr:DUF1566 domain-containing protein [Gammaproteobacteria bacterium]